MIHTNDNMHKSIHVCVCVYTCMCLCASLCCVCVFTGLLKSIPSSIFSCSRARRNQRTHRIPSIPQNFSAKKGTNARCYTSSKQKLEVFYK